MIANQQKSTQQIASWGSIRRELYASVWRRLSSFKNKTTKAGINPADDLVHCLLTMGALACFVLFLPFGLMLSFLHPHKAKLHAQETSSNRKASAPLPKRMSTCRAELRFVHDELLKKGDASKYAGRTRQAPPYVPHAMRDAETPPRYAAAPEQDAAPRVDESTPSKSATKDASAIATVGMRIAQQLASAEFWLAVVFGLVTRVSTKIAIAAAFEPTHLLSRSAAGFVACAGAGVVAAIIVCLVRALYRNSKSPAAGAKEKYWSKALIESATIGFFGGAIGGCVANASVWIARAGSLAVGVAAGATVGVAHAAVKAAGTSRDQRTGRMWGRGLLQGLGLGALGGIASILLGNLFNVREAIAATVSDLRASLIPPGHSAILVLPNGCANGPCMVPPLASAQPMQPIAAIQVAVVDHSAPQTVVHDGVRADDCHHVASAKHIHHAHHHHRHHRHYAHAHQMPSVEVYAAFEPVVVVAPPPPPPLAVVPIYWEPPPPPPQPMSYDPCQMGDCAPCPPPPPTYPNQVDLQGPCAGSGALCAERVSFNERGEATGAVLEPQTAPITEPRFETQRVSENTDSGNTVTAWSRNAREMAQSQPVSPYPELNGQDDSGSGDARVSLVVPFTNGGLQPSFS